MEVIGRIVLSTRIPGLLGGALHNHTSNRYFLGLLFPALGLRNGQLHKVIVRIHYLWIQVIVSLAISKGEEFSERKGSGGVWQDTAQKHMKNGVPSHGSDGGVMVDEEFWNLLDVTWSTDWRSGDVS